MQDRPLFILSAVAVLIVAAILMTGIGGFARGGAFNRNHGNRLMRWRIIAQALALLVVLGFIAIRGR